MRSTKLLEMMARPARSRADSLVEGIQTRSVVRGNP